MTTKPSPPPHLAAPESKLWRTIVADYNIDDSGGLAILAVALEAAGRARRCREMIDASGELTAEGKPHPLLLCERDSRKLFLSALRQLELDVESAAGSAGRPPGPAVRRIK